MEILTFEGDLLVFGLDLIPSQKMHAEELNDLVTGSGGVAISAHPFRNNGRGMGEYIKQMNNLTGVEAFNGNTGIKENFQAYDLSTALGLAGVVMLIS